MRIHIGEGDKYHGKLLYEVIVEMLRSRHFAGCTVLRGIMGFGAHSHLHTDRFLELSSDLPIIIECVETAENIDSVLPELDEILEGGLITLERAKVIMYRGHVPPERRTGSWAIEMTGDTGKDQPPEEK